MKAGWSCALAFLAACARAAAPLPPVLAVQVKPEPPPPAPPATTAPGPCADEESPPDRAALVITLAEPDGAPARRAEVTVDACCGDECPHLATDERGRVVIDACPGPTRDVIITVQTNPTFYTYTPPRAVRVCRRVERVAVLVQPHPGRRDPKLAF